MPRHLLQFRRQFHMEDILEKLTAHLLEERDDILLVHEAHLAVDLCKLGLTIGPEVLITEAFRNLEVAVESAHHQQLFKRLRALRQGIKLSRVHA